MLKSCSSEKNIRDSLRIVERKGKKDSSTKISICSNKQASKQNERGSDDKQTTKKGLGRISINLFNPTSRTVKPIITIETGREDKHKLKEKSARITTFNSSIDQNGPRANNTLTEAQKEVIESIRIQFQQRIKTIISQNAKQNLHNERTVQQLRSSLCQLHQKIAQKEQIISHLMSTKHIKRLNTEETTSRSSSHKQSIFYSTKPAVDNANIELLWSKTHYLQTNLRAIIERFAENDSVKEKLSRIQKGFFSNLYERVSRCWASLQRYCMNLDNKCHQIEAAIENFIRNAPIMSQCKENTERFKEKFNGLTLQFKTIEQDIASFKEKMQTFQNNVDSGIPAQENPYFDDDDQFFYPATSRRTPSEASLIHM